MTVHPHTNTRLVFLDAEVSASQDGDAEVRRRERGEERRRDEEHRCCHAASVVCYWVKYGMLL